MSGVRCQVSAGRGWPGAGERQRVWCRPSVRRSAVGHRCVKRRDRRGSTPSGAAKAEPGAGLAKPQRGTAQASAGPAPIYSHLPTDDPEFREIVEEFLTRLQNQLAAMQTAAETQDYAELARLGHWLKGSGGTVGFNVFTDPAHELEKAAKSGRAPDIALALARIQDLAARAAVPADTLAATP